MEWPGAVSRETNLTWGEVGWQGLHKVCYTKPLSTSTSFQEMKHEDDGRAEIWAVCGLDAAGWAGAKQGFEPCQSFLEMEGHMMRKQEDEVWNFGGTQSC